MKETASLLTVLLVLNFHPAFGAETNVVRMPTLTGVAKSVTLEGREARKNAGIRPFDLNKDGKLDGAERALLMNDLKAKSDPVRKRVYVPKAEPRQPLTPEPPVPAAPNR